MMLAFRIALWSAIAVVALAGGAVWSGMVAVPRSGSVAVAPEIGGPFTLQGHDGKARTWSHFRNKPTAVFFGFTQCPDICPTTLGELGVLLEDLGPDGDRLNVALISVDPERDTPAVLANYMSAFDPRIIALTGTEQQVDEAVAAFKAYRKRVPLEGGGYTMDHTAAIYLFRADGSFAGTLDRHEKAEDRSAKIQRLIGA